MIEQINGTGLSGITGKSGKQGKNSLFAKLLAMFDKHALATGKGKGLQLNAAGLGKTKTVTTMSGTGELPLMQKAEPLTVAKGKKLVALAAKSKLTGETQAEETAAPLLAYQVIMNQPLQSKKADLAGKATVLIADGKTATQGQQVNSNSEQASPVLKVAQQAESKVTAATFNKTAEAEESIQLANKPLPTGATATTPTTATSVTGSKGMASVSLSENAEQTNTVDSRPQDSKATTRTTDLGGHVHKPTVSGQTSANIQVSANTAELKSDIPILQEGNKATASLETTAKQLADKPAMQAKPESINVAAAAQPQQGKPAQVSHAQGNPATAAVSTSVQTSTSDASLTDSGSGSDKGSQEGRMASALSGDAKSSNATSTNNANFQNYMTGKTTPAMSVFDSMKHIAQSAANGQTKLEIQLDPANLGKIQITLQTDAAKQLQVHMVVDQGTTRTALEQQLPTLRAALSQQGFDLSGFSMGSNGQQESSAESGRYSSRNLADNGDNHSTGNSSNPVQQQSTRSADGSLSIRV
ncbi:flagellar hook-length control protein FliK [Mariprofundus micogutta]|nr:flagellar hook-length control protein FliK [Mariprofundus micogutta]